ncbi:MAG TPA: phosphatidylserine decarboxylase [Stackebrandtia sp.]|jgi:phosphatidylserine decarboxylase|uniref:phosphatidylserine decarboxylase n=1 Tax=Stackebrandtia sp. TaxID=2023065 RepID=UPI002D713980|nr:phosphatidylserine decarboxylase [Stackebrandtia sp.]HZE41121.1 phosphatidylserine decarboxylase [Stackebrandtia sp.]
MPFSPSVSRRAARVIADEFIRHAGPKTGLILGAGPGHPVLAAAIDALLPGDKLTVVLNSDTDRPAMESYLADQGSWVVERVSLVASPSDAAPADVVMLAEPVRDEAGDFAKTSDTLRELTAAGGVLTLSAPLTSHATDDLAELNEEFGIGSDLVLRNRPPLRIHRLRFSAATPDTAERIAPTFRPSSVPLTSRMNIDSNGLAAGAILLGVAGLTKKVRPKSKLWLVPALAAVPAAAFFRDPQRHTDDDPDAVVSAGDGTVLSVERVTDDRFGTSTSDNGGEWLRIAVFLSILDVHVNRAPVAGKVVDIFREEGGYAPAMKPDAEHNVACYTVLDTARGRVAVAQRTGLVARRIVNRTQPGALLAKGERYGLIRFGSRTDVYLPADSADALVVPGEKVVGAETVIARWRAPKRKKRK